MDIQYARRVMPFYVLNGRHIEFQPFIYIWENTWQFDCIQHAKLHIYAELG